MTIEDRLTKLERQNRRMRVVTGGALLALAAFVAVVATGQRGPGPNCEVLTVGKLLVTEALTVGKEHFSPARGLHEGEGAVWVSPSELMLRNTRSTIALRPHPKGGSVVIFSGTSSCSAALSVSDENVSFGCLNGTEPTIVLKTTGSDPTLSLQSKSRRTLINPGSLVLGSEEDGEPAMLGVIGPDKEMFAATAGKGLVKAFAGKPPGATVEVCWNEAAGGNVQVCDRDGEPRAVLGATTTVNKRTGAETTTAESTLTLFGPDGAVLEQLPR